MVTPPIRLYYYIDIGYVKISKTDEKAGDTLMETLYTKRLVLRPPMMEDVELLHKELGCNPDMIRYTGWNPFDTVEHAKEKTEEDIRRFENGKFYSWIITFQGLPVGTIGAYGYDEKDESIEIGYSIFEGEWGKGYGCGMIPRRMHQVN